MWVRVCSVCSLRVKFNIELSFSEMRRFYWIKLINAYTQREKESGGVHKTNFEVNKINFGSAFVVKYINICITFWIYQILFGQLKPVSTFLTFAIKIKLLENYQKRFLFYQKSSFCPRHYQIFVLHSSPLFFLSWPLLVL